MLMTKRGSPVKSKLFHTMQQKQVVLTEPRMLPTLVCAFQMPMTAPRLPLPYQLPITATTLGHPVACMNPAAHLAGSLSWRLHHLDTIRQFFIVKNSHIGSCG